MSKKVKITFEEEFVLKALEDNKNFRNVRKEGDSFVANIGANLIEAPPLSVQFRMPTIEPPTYFRLTPERLQYYDEQVRRLAVGSGHYEAVPDPPFPSMAAEHMRQSREISQEMSERIGAEFHRIIERAGERYGSLPVELFARIVGGESMPESELRELFGLEPPRFGLGGGNVITDDDLPCKKCREKDDTLLWITNEKPYCHKCLDSSKERIIYDWCKRHEYLPKVREMRRRGADTEEWLLFIRSSLRKKT